ncbi:hypothetical protein ASE01_16800 [Nocardioides sp. Root190]|uniref:hypothetical protein n=1 Tax=Nocardioides sp. Root190 TaxID=1736488 RepID=UPI0006FF68ED|nr:hypothetical protein [Nocardioides sp. Root190]KRB75025.1 hypothetical protein ASE01_16800 [Nocardioides sp. Root190]
MTASDTVLQATEAVVDAERAIGHARRVVDDLRTTIASALRVLEDVELDAAKARLTDRRDFYLGAAVEHVGRLQSRVVDLPHQTNGFYGYLTFAASSIADARDHLNQPESSSLSLAREVAQLSTRVAVVDELISVAKPIARLVTRHVDSALAACEQVTQATLLESMGLERSIETAGRELSRADEDVRVLGDVVDHAESNARQASRLAGEISDDVQRRMSQHRRDAAPSASVLDVRSPSR